MLARTDSVILSLGDLEEVGRRADLWAGRWMEEQSACQTLRNARPDFRPQVRGLRGWQRHRANCGCINLHCFAQFAFIALSEPQADEQSVIRLQRTTRTFFAIRCGIFLERPSHLRKLGALRRSRL